MRSTNESTENQTSKKKLIKPMLTKTEVKDSPKPKLQTKETGIFEAIRNRRATRAYSSQKVSEDIVRSLIDLSILAPSAMNQQAWSFVVVQNPEILKQISEETKSKLAKNPEISKKHTGEHGHQFLTDSAFDIFYGATTLVIICAKVNAAVEFGPETDCFLAGENLMLASTGMGLATCPIGLARDVLREPAMAKKLGISDNFTAVLPIVVGYGCGENTSAKRAAPVIHWVR